MADLFSGELSQSTPSVFTFGTNTVRVVMRDGEPWFVASDICAALGYKNASKAVADHLDADERYNESLERGGFLVLISESGMYTLVLRSHKPEARKFAKWVTGEVLPTIRKTGGYGKPAADTERIKLAFTLAAEAAAQVERTVFDAVMAGDAGLWRHSRYLLNLNYDRDGKATVPWCGALPFEALAVTIDELPERLTGSDAFSATDVQLARLAAACSQRLERRAQQRADKESTRPSAVLFKCTEPGKLTRV